MSDSIERQAAIHFKVSHGIDDDSVLYVPYGEVKKYLEQLPSAQPERKKGKWIPVTNGRGGHECDQCHEYAPSWATGEEHLTNYCPNCGLPMETEVGE